MNFLTDKLIERARAGNLDALVKLDAHGLLIGPEESLADFVARVTTLKTNIAEFKDQLKRENVIDFHGFRLKNENEIPANVFNSASRETQDMWGFSIDWVPGYFTDDRMGILFAGCAMHSLEDMFAVFVIRQAYKKKAKWFIYERSELLSHELTHIAHLGFWTPNYEEFLAYQSSKSAFRRLVGGIFRKPGDTYLVLGSMLLMLVYQGFNIVMRQVEAIWTMPTPLLFGLALSPLLWLLLIYLRNRRVLLKAKSNLVSQFKCKPLPVLFRCSEDEIRTLAKLPASEIKVWVDARCDDQPRWQVIRDRFLT